MFMITRYSMQTIGSIPPYLTSQRHILEIQRGYRGRNILFWELTLNLQRTETISVTASHHINKVLEDFRKELHKKVVSLKISKLFKVHENLTPIDSDRMDHFHSITENLMWILKISHPDLETLLSFLIMRLKDPAEEYWIKLSRVINFITVQSMIQE